MARIHLSGGGVYDFSDPKKSRFSIEELAYACSTINRFTGHANPPMNVLQHQLLVETILNEQGMSPTVRLAGLVHDLHEAIIGDVATPIKQAIGPGWYELERQTEKVVATVLELPFNWLYPEVKTADLIALATECRDRLHIDPFAWNLGVIPRDEPIAEVSPSLAPFEYMRRVNELKQAAKQDA